MNYNGKIVYAPSQQQIGASANKQGGKTWYANLSNEKKAEHLRKLRAVCQQTAALVLNVDVPQSSTQQCDLVNNINLSFVAIF